MSQIIVEQPLAGILRTSPESTELVDSDGRMIGYFIPSAKSLQELYDRAWDEFDAADFAAAVAEGGGRPLDDILRDLRNQS
jgi:hypothetical protein